MQLFRASSRVEASDGRTTLFWEDRWLDGFRIEELAPLLYAKVRPRVRASRTMVEALTNNAGARDVGPRLTVMELAQFL